MGLLSIWEVLDLGLHITLFSKPSFTIRYHMNKEVLSHKSSSIYI